MRRSFLRRTASFGLIALLLAGPASKPGSSQTAPSGPPAVGVVEAARRPVTESYEFMGRVQATDRVELVARVPAFLEEQFFTEGAEVKKGDLLYRLEQPPYQADLEAKQAAIAQAEAQLKNAEIQLHRAKELLKGPAGSQMRYDDALTVKLSAEAQLRAAQAAAHQSQINLDYTEIRAPVDGRISRTSVTIGNVVGPTSGTLATIVSQDPMYVTFPVPTRTAVDLRNRYVVQGGFNAVAIKIRLPDGRMYGQPGTINFADVTISQDTDTLTVRGTIPNPVLSNSGVGWYEYSRAHGRRVRDSRRRVGEAGRATHGAARGGAVRSARRLRLRRGRKQQRGTARRPARSVHIRDRGNRGRTHRRRARRAGRRAARPAGHEGRSRPR